MSNVATVKPEATALKAVIAIESVCRESEADGIARHWCRGSYSSHVVSLGRLPEPRPQYKNYRHRPSSSY